ncbi:MAG: helix-turn-helix domain-containing protein [Ignavibacteriae bacterium]|nr:MAG: helix-turn-helix domain-containing protein [Ignavibacteriota bacterium]
MNFEQIGEELRKTRLEKDLSLMDISAETRISLKFLEAIEKGQFQILPQTYVRAFLREYAFMVGLDPNEIMLRYDDAKQESSLRKTEPSVLPTNTPLEKKSGSVSDKQIRAFTPLQRNITIGFFIIAALVLTAVLANRNRGSNSGNAVEEVPFDRVVRENEAASIPSPDHVSDSVLVAVPVRPDSLRLEMVTRDSVWINILIDGKLGETYLLGPNRKRMWVAKDRFVVTMGNAGSATFQLNGKDIGSLGKRGAVVRNAVISEANLKN